MKHTLTHLVSKFYHVDGYDVVITKNIDDNIEQSIVDIVSLTRSHEVPIDVVHSTITSVFEVSDGGVNTLANPEWSISLVLQGTNVKTVPNPIVLDLRQMICLLGSIFLEVSDHDTLLTDCMELAVLSGLVVGLYRSTSKRAVNPLI